ncbi:MAG: UPF0489 family protein [Bacteroidota bacterium]|nr:UPF0489 family protein [Bacteroidota bacterium]
MPKIKFRNPYSLKPPGSIYEILEHPGNSSIAIELAVFQEHRYAFFYWSKWLSKNKLINPPCLVTFDWHQDLCYPCEGEKEILKNLDITNQGDVSVCCWANLAGNNDGHILAAAFLNLIGNIYVLCRQATLETDWDDEEFVDLYGNKHLIKKFKDEKLMSEYLINSNEANVYFDIDLDYFTIKNPYNGIGKKFTYMPKRDIQKLLSVDSVLINWIFKRLCGITIATEPEHCGGLLKSNQILNTINSLYFEPELFSQNCEWKHKLNSN